MSTTFILYVKSEGKQQYKRLFSKKKSPIIMYPGRADDACVLRGVTLRD